MSTTACAQPGCTGAILDGYCDVCGSSADQPPASPSQQRVSGPCEASKVNAPVSRRTM